MSGFGESHVESTSSTLSFQLYIWIPSWVSFKGISRSLGWLSEVHRIFGLKRTFHRYYWDQDTGTSLSSPEELKSAVRIPLPSLYVEFRCCELEICSLGILKNS
jgi:hypothetical protein